MDSFLFAPIGDTKRDFVRVQMQIVESLSDNPAAQHTIIQINGGCKIMAKKTKEELAEVKRKRLAKKEEEERQAEIMHEKELLDLSEKRSNYLRKQKEYELINSDLKGWYDELDKLTKRSPADTVTDLQLETVNDLIVQVKQLITEDDFIEKVKQFVPAGNNPEYRDVIGVLRRLKQGLDRFIVNLKKEHDVIQEQADETLDLDDEDFINLDLKSDYNREDFIDPSIYDQLK